MFSSSAGHWDNLELIKSHIIKILDKYPNTTFYQYDFLPLISEDKKYKGRIKTMKWVHPDKYWKYINSFSPDICLAPLTDSLYNRAKSNLRLLEYWTSGNNLVIASPIGHYKETIVDGKNGLFARNSEWFDKIEYAIQHPELRERLGKGGRKTVEKDYNLEKNARLWVDAVRSIIKNYKPDKQAPEQYIAPEFK
jgi:glycosyltransferase involved in cell wall biosynthesis